MSQSPDAVPWHAAFTSARLRTVLLLSFSSGAPLGFVLIFMPYWLSKVGYDPKAIGVFQLAQLPYGFKFLWSPLMDRVQLGLGRRRGWIALTQLSLSVLFALYAFNTTAPTIAMAATLMFGICFVSASQDIAYDAFAVDTIKAQERGAVVGWRSGLYQVGMRMAGNLAISLSAIWAWSTIGFALAGVFVLLLPVTLLATELPTHVEPPKSLTDAVWQPLVGFLSRPRALEIVAFVALYRMADSLAGALISVFLDKHGYSAWDIGVFRAIVDFFGNLAGTVAGGLLASRLGLSRALWVGAGLLIASNAGYAVVASVPPDRWVLGGALAIETACGGVAWGAFGVLLLKLTDKRFSATQYALFSSLVGLTRTLMSPVAGVMVDALGWRDFFIATMFAGLPGAALLWRFAPWGSEPAALAEELPHGAPAGTPWPRATLWGLGLLGGLVSGAVALCLTSLMTAVKHWRSEHQFDFSAVLWSTVSAATQSDAVTLGGLAIFGVLGGLATAAYLAARGRRP